jgi:glucose-1-phosphate thymidylyltransferase
MRARRALILAGGLGRRMQAADPDAPLDDAQRKAAESGLKALMPIEGRPFLDYVLSSLADAGYDDVGLVVSPGINLLRQHYEVHVPSRVTLQFIVQRTPRGTADAILSAEAWADDDPFVALNADNLYPVEALRALAMLDGPGLPVFDRQDLVESSNIPVERVQAFALLEVGPSHLLERIIEKPTAEQMPPHGAPMLVSMNCWRLDVRIFDACRDVPVSSRGEVELPQAVALAIARGVPFRAIPARGPVLDLSRRSDAAVVADRLRDVAVSV